MHLLQIKEGHLKTYDIEETGIVVRHFTNPKLPTVDNFPYENIKRDGFFYVSRSPTFLIVGGIVLIFFAFSLAYNSEPKTSSSWISVTMLGALALTLISSYFLFAKRVYFLKTLNGKHIRFRVKRNENDISIFIEKAIVARDSYINMKYGTPNPHLSYDSQYSNFSIMLRENMITQVDFQEKVTVLNSLFNQTKPSQIFSTYNQN